MLWYLSTCEDNYYKVYIQNSWNKFWCISQWKDNHHKLYSRNDITYFGTNYNRKNMLWKNCAIQFVNYQTNIEKKIKKIENVEIIMIINLMGRNPILELDVNIFWSFSKYVLKMITITSDTWSKYPGIWCTSTTHSTVFLLESDDWWNIAWPCSRNGCLLACGKSDCASTIMTKLMKSMKATGEMNTDY
jgi:hypothetical protein